MDNILKLINIPYLNLSCPITGQDYSFFNVVTTSGRYKSTIAIEYDLKGGFTVLECVSVISVHLVEF